MLRENILIKDLTGKIGNGKQYIRLAIRNSEENDQLLEALKKNLGE
jgi:histidinol-phosphate/aromatic aminotransferase/cobyric acid decarboxylase-like protein